MASSREYLENMNGAGQELGGYNPSGDVQAANQTLAAVNAGKPANYTNADADRMGQLYDSIINQGTFSYDPAKDSVYQDARKSYFEGGQKAMNDTRKQTAGLNGGYGNTWARSVGSQQFDEYMRGINDIMPALENNAYNAYNSEAERLNAAYQIAQQRDNTAYGRYRDQVSDWQADRDFAQQQADNAYARDYQEYSNRMNMAGTAAGWSIEDQQNDRLNDLKEREYGLRDREYDQRDREYELNDRSYAQKDREYALNDQAYAQKERGYAQDERSEAYSWAITLIQQGIMPTPEVLANAGISNLNAKRLAAKYGYGQDTGSSGSKKKKSGSGSSTTTSVPVGQRTATNLTR